MLDSNWTQELKIKPVRQLSSIELFAGGGGLALGLEKAGFNSIALNEFDKEQYVISEIVHQFEVNLFKFSKSL